VQRFRLLFSGAIIFAVASVAAVALAQDTHEVVDQELSRPVIRGGLVFRNYCALCHGERGDGIARATKLYTGASLVIRPRPPEFYEKIIRNGGQLVGASPYMPPWRDELDDEQVRDVVAFLSVISDPVRRGEVTYKTNCILCHGLRGDGKGRAAALYTPPPANLTQSNKTDQYLEQIIRLGGEPMHRSPAMPAWNERLTAVEIEDLVLYLRSMRVAAPTR
jgi:cytochrome c oxidase cbb3-type subunit 3